MNFKKNSHIKTLTSSISNLKAGHPRSNSKAEIKQEKKGQTLPKRSGLKNENSPHKKVTKTKGNADKMTKSLGKEQKIQKVHSRNRLISHNSSNQEKIEGQKRPERRESRYIFNQLLQNKNRGSLTIKPRKGSEMSHTKSYSNQTVLRNVFNQTKDSAFNIFNKTSNADLSKIKKKKHDYIKALSKTSCFEKSVSTGFNSIGYEMNDTNEYDLKVETDEFEKVWEGCQNKNDGLAHARKDHLGMIKQVRNDVNCLFRKLKPENKTKLLKISNSYEKIVSDLWNVIKQKNRLGQCDLSRINTCNSSKTQKQNISPIETNINAPPYAQCVLKNSAQQQSTPSGNYIIQQSQLYLNDQSEHWDSYLDFDGSANAKQVRQSVLMRQIDENKPIVKKLNLGGLREMHIQQYQDQFMDLKEGFSQSWKRNLQEEKRF